MKRIVLAVLIVLMSISPALADTIHLRDGRQVRGTFLGFIGGRFVMRVSNPTTRPGRAGARRTAGDEGEIQFFRPRDVERIEIEGRSLDEARFVTRKVEVTLGPNWIDTGVDVRRGQRVQVRADGTINIGRVRVTPDGLRSRPDAAAPMPSAAEGALIGAIGADPNSPVVEIGLSREFIADRDGRLYLTINRGSLAGVTGAYDAQIRVERGLPRRGRAAAGAGLDEDEDDDLFDAFGPGRGDPAPVRSRTPGGQISSVAPPGPREVTISVPGNSRGTDTGVDLRAGDQVMMTATGGVFIGRREGIVPPDGGRVVPSVPVTNAGIGALIGFLRTPGGQNSVPFVVGSRAVFTSPADGRLFLFINDDIHSDNRGSFRVTIRH